MPHPIVYTHNFDIQLGAGSYIHPMQGELEFNVDGTASFRTTQLMEGMTIEQNRLVNSLFDICKSLYNEFKGIEKIEITKKP